MAVVKIVPAYIPLGGNVAMPALTAITSATDGAVVPFKDQDTKIVVMVKNSGSAAGDITFKQGDGIQGVADLVVSVPAGETHLFVVESGKYKMTSGANKGHVQVVGATTMQVGAVVLP